MPKIIISKIFLIATYTSESNLNKNFFSQLYSYPLSCKPIANSALKENQQTTINNFDTEAGWHNLLEGDRLNKWRPRRKKKVFLMHLHGQLKMVTSILVNQKNIENMAVV